MRILGRLCAILVAGAWCAAMGAGIWAVWQLGQTTLFDHRGATLTLANNLSRSDQTMATVILALLIVPAALAILGALAPGGRRTVAARSGAVGDDRYSTLESRLSRLEGSDRPATYAERDRPAGYVERDREVVPAGAPVMAKEKHRGFFGRLFHHDRPARAV